MSQAERLVIQVCTERNEAFYTIDEHVLMEAAKRSETDVKAARVMVQSARESTTVHSTSEVDHVLVFDGKGEEESFKELRKQLGM